MSVPCRISWFVAGCASLACSGHASTGSSQVRPTDSAAGSPNAGATGGVDVPNGNGGGVGAGITLDVDGGDPTAAAGAGGSSVQIITMLPAGFKQTEIGGFQLGAALGNTNAAGGSGGDASGVIGGAGGVSNAGGSAGSASGGTASAGAGGALGSTNGNCGNILIGVARDFRGQTDPGGNADFESTSFWGQNVTPNLVAATLGMDQKPAYTSKCELGSAVTSTACPYGAQTTTQANFDQWYRDTANMNQPFVVSLYLAPQPGGLFTFQSLFYFPLDNAGYGNSGTANDHMQHNFSFTTEIHTRFAYNGGETFQFQGDDDVWVFINGKMTVDLGGLHPAMTGTVNLDSSAVTLGMQKGGVYALDLFHAERHTDKSTFRIDTNLSFTNCGTVEAGPPK
jgi:fibro-slime domain-containing protein